jgi:hypothetical protein
MNRRWEELNTEIRAILYAETEQKYEAALRSFQQGAGARNPVILSYIEQTWLPHKEKFVTAWADHCLHYGNRATSRAEGYHKIIKALIPNSIGHLKDVIDRFVIYLRARNQALLANRARQEIRYKKIHDCPLLILCRGKIAPHALDQVLKIKKQFNLSPITVLPACTGRVNDLINLPCRHII